MFNCLAIDIGAGSGRIMRCTISDAGKVDLTEIARFPNNSREVDGVLRWDIEALITDIKAGLAKGAAEQKPDAVAVDTWGVDYLLLDKEGNCLADPACYRDPRTVGLDAEFVERFGKERLQRLTGIQIMNINTLFQLYAESRANADYAARAEHFLFVPDYIAYRLSGVIANEFTIASTSQLLDCAKADWSDELLEAVRLPRRCVKPLTQPGTRIGTCDFSGVKGLEGVPCVMVGSHDTASGVAAAPAVGEKNWAYIASGTWCLTGIESPKALATPRAADRNFTHEGGGAHPERGLKDLPGFWIRRGLQSEPSAVLQSGVDEGRGGRIHAQERTGVPGNSGRVYRNVSRKPRPAVPPDNRGGRLHFREKDGSDSSDGRRSAESRPLPVHGGCDRMHCDGRPGGGNRHRQCDAPGDRRRKTRQRRIGAPSDPQFV